MFQTELNIAVQSISSDFLTWLVLQVTATGSYFFIAAVVIAVMFGFSLRKGFLLFQVVVWTAVVSGMAKRFFGLPRPFFSDSRVACLDPYWRATGAFPAMGGGDFFDLPPQQVIEACRLRRASFGFPSGHTSGAVALWGGLALVFRKRALIWLAPFMVALIAFTRIYLGVHFLADVLGGVLLGALMLFVFWKLSGGDDGQKRFFAAACSGLFRSLPWLLYVLFLFVLPLTLALFSSLNPKLAGFYIGVNAAFTLLLKSGLPVDDGSFSARLCRALLGGILFLTLSLLLRRGLLPPSMVGDSAWAKFLMSALGAFLALWGGVRLFLRLGLYRRD